ncbi:MAG TPA: hypothetical protein VH476_11375 [Solirubrobacterales bacterium]
MGRKIRLGRRALVAVLSIAATAGLCAGQASAKQIQEYKFVGSFTGADSTGGAFTSQLEGLAVNNSNGRVYVLDRTGSNLELSQFSATGEAVPWSALAGVSTFSPGGAGFGSPDVVFDNTGHEGGIYVAGSIENRHVGAWNPDGTQRLQGMNNGGGNCGVGVDPEGFIYNGTGQWAPRFNPTTGFQDPNGVLWFYEQQTCHITFDSEGYGYLNKASNYSSGEPGLYKYYKGEENWTCCTFEQGFGDHSSLKISYENVRYSAADLSNNDIYAVENGNKISEYSSAGQPITSFGGAEGPFTGLTEANGVAVNATNHDVYVTMKGATPRVAIFQQQAPITVPGATTAAAAHPNKTSAVLKGVVNPDGVSTTECKFEWGTTTQYLNGSVPCDEGNVFNGSSDASVSHTVTSLTPGTVFHYRVVAKNANNHWSYGADRIFEASIAPSATPVVVDKVNTDGARFSVEINPNGGTTHYHFEYGTEDCEVSACTSIPASDESLESRLENESVTQTATGLSPNTLYHVQVVAENGAGRVVVPYVFRTYPSPVPGDSCANAQVRKQTGTSQLLDCRAYELVSAANAGGYDVESDLVPGQSPFPGYPEAENRLLYGLHFGSVPGIAGSPTNNGLDPYVAERGSAGWTTRYVGIPANGMADSDPFGSPLLAADSKLDTFAFGGPAICDPCFNGLGSNIPIRIDGGAAEPGMAGSLNPGESAPEGYVAKYMSTDGSHLVFGSTEKFETAGAAGSLTIYERDLNTGTTEVVSTDQNGATLSGPDIASLDVSSDGSRVVIGKKISTDAAGNDHYHLYLHTSGSTHSADLTPGGDALYSGMSADGSRVFMTTTDQLLPADTDSSADIYEADVSGAGTVTLRLVSVKSTGAVSNSDACTPPGYPESWNSVSGDAKCSAVAFAGGSGVAEDGSFFFVSPEQLDGSEGEPNQANLYLVRPGNDPQFVATIDSSVGKAPQAPPNHPLANENLTGETHSGAESVAVDQSNGDVYVAETGNGKLARFTSAGAAHNFSAVQPYIEGNRITGLTLGSNSASQVAVDNAASSPFDGDLYVSGNTKVQAFAPSGENIGEITGSATFAGSFNKACGVAVNQANGVLYIGDYGNEAVLQYTPKPAATAPITDSDYEVKAIKIPGFNPCNVAADKIGNVYASRAANGPVRGFEASSFAAPFGLQTGITIDEASRAITTDPSNNDLYVNEANQIRIFNSSGEFLNTVGSEFLSGSRGVAVNGNNHHTYAPNALKIADFGYELAAWHPIDNPAVIDGVKQAGKYSTADFQQTPDGHFAVFASSLPLTGFANLGHSEIYRYDTQQQSLECASCATTGAGAKSDTTLAPNGLNVTDDGRVFFTTKEGLVLSDTNEKRDAYEWAGGLTISSISTGRSLADSTLLTVTRDGRDAFFFTRDVLVPEDENGGAVKIYDAREGGGYLQSSKPLPCAASDECHGPGTQAPPPPNINSVTGEGPKRQTSSAAGCSDISAEAKAERKKANELKRKASKASSPQKAKELRRKAKSASKRAKQLEKQAKACKRSSGGAG